MTEEQREFMGIGEVLWDILPAGKQLGGAPANFAWFVNALGARGSVISRVGSDELGTETLRRLTEMGVGIDLITTDTQHETGRATVSLDAAGVPQFTIHEPAAWDFMPPNDAAIESVARAAAVCFGTLGRRHTVSRESIRKMLAAASAATMRVYDINLRKPFYTQELIDEGLALADVVKMNDEELSILSKMYSLGGDEIDRLGALRDQFKLRLVALTKGSNGSVLLQGQSVSNRPAVPVAVRDTIGAGDAFTAALTVGLLQGLTLESVHARAARLASYVCSQPGATPPIPDEFARGGGTA